MFSIGGTTYAQVVDLESPTGITTYVWGDHICEPVKWDYFTHDILKTVSGHLDEIFVLTADNNLFYCKNKSCNEFIKINHDFQILDVECLVRNKAVVLTDDGAVYCEKYDTWSENINCIKPVNFGNNVTITKIACGYFHFISLDVHGKVYSNGRNDHGQLGLGDKIKRSNPQLIDSIADKFVTQIACGGFFSVFVENDTNMYTCGYNNNGPLGLGLPCGVDVDIPTVVKFEENINIRTVQCGRIHVIILTDAHEIYVTGSCILNATGIGKQCYVPTRLNIPDKSETPIIDVYAGESSTTIVYENAVYTCGCNWYGQLGLGHKNNVEKHVEIPFFVNNRLAIKSGYGRFTKSAASKIVEK